MLWQAESTRISNSTMWKFIEFLNLRCESFNPTISDPVDYVLVYQQLHTFSTECSGEFWQAVIEFFQIRCEGELKPANTDEGFKHYGWFPELKLNFAENLLAHGKDEDIAVCSIFESSRRHALSYSELRKQVAAIQKVLSPLVNEGDVVACYMPNSIETLVSMLATTALGGVFTSTSCDFGQAGVIDRFGQSKPKVLIAASRYEYNGKRHDNREKIKAIKSAIPSIEKLIIVDHFEIENDDLKDALTWKTALQQGTGYDLQYRRVAFDAPLYIMYSSGTTGKPKCIVHGVGGTLLQHIKELGLHCDHQASKTIFFYTTCGWMMWNWLVSSLFFGGKTILYEGSPAYPSFADYLKLIDSEKINIFGTSPKFLKALEDSHSDLSSLDLTSLETILSTGSPLLPEQFDFVYQSIKQDVLLASISGGTDILGCFFLGNPMLPVYRGELQCAGLGMDMVCYDEEGQPVYDQEGELICRKSFPSRPIYFLNDENNERINAAYFNQFQNVWYHGDYIKINSRGAAVFYGRSDATLNPGGVRIGTSEIYRQTEKLSYIVDAVCIGRQEKGDVSVLLFVQLADGEVLTDERVAEIKSTIKSGTTPRHVPKEIYAIPAIPYTRSGKKVEIAVSNIVNGKRVNNLEALANPQCLEAFKRYSTNYSGPSQ